MDDGLSFCSSLIGIGKDAIVELETRRECLFQV